jgi:hypothetical protein
VSEIDGERLIDKSLRISELEADLERAREQRDRLLEAVKEHERTFDEGLLNRESDQKLYVAAREIEGEK